MTNYQKHDFRPGCECTDCLQFMEQLNVLDNPTLGDYVLRVNNKVTPFTFGTVYVLRAPYKKWIPTRLLRVRWVKRFLRRFTGLWDEIEDRSTVVLNEAPPAGAIVDMAYPVQIDPDWRG